LSAWDSSSGDPAVSQAAALASTDYGLAILIEDTDPVYARKVISQQAVLRIRLYIDPNGISIPNGNNLYAFLIQQNGGGYAFINSLRLNNNSGQYRLVWNASDDASGYSDYCDISDDAHYVEWVIRRASSAVASDGSTEWWVDGVSQGTQTNLDNYNTFADQDYRVYMGAPTGIPSGTSGTYYLDELIMRDNDTVIGMASYNVSGKALADLSWWKGLTTLRKHGRPEPIKEDAAVSILADSEPPPDDLEKRWNSHSEFLNICFANVFLRERQYERCLQ
jgi:hypothetical protein